MSGILAHRETLAGYTNRTDVGVSKTKWTDYHTFENGVNGNLAVRDTSDADYGSRWSDGLTFVGKALALAQGALVADAPAWASTATWNNAAVTFTHWSLAVTDTASAAGSLLMAVTVGGVAAFSVSKSGIARAPSVETPIILGAELVTLNGAFGTGAGWTFGSGKWTHGAGFSALTSGWTPTAGHTYQVTISTADWAGPAGGFTCSLGAQRFGAVADNVANLIYYVTATTADPMMFVPTPDTYGTTYNGSLSGLSVKDITSSPSVIPILSVGTLTLGVGRIVFSEFAHEYFFGYGAGEASTGSYSNGFGNSALHGNTGIQSNGVGLNALNANTGAHSNGMGSHVLQNNTGIHANAIGLSALFGNAGNYAVGIGDNAGNANTKPYLTAVGSNAGNSNTGSETTVVGYQAGDTNTGDSLTAVGFKAGIQNSGVNGPVFIGDQAGYTNTGQDTVGVGYQALYANTGYRSTGLGWKALLSNTGNYNTAVGWSALAGGTNTGQTNTAVGSEALKGNTSGAGSVAIGNTAGKYSTTQGNEFFVNNQDRTNRAGDIAKSLLYGVFAATAAGQSLTMNLGALTLAPAYLDVGTIATPASPAASTGRIYFDTLAGKVRLLVLFPSGAAQLLGAEL